MGFQYSFHNIKLKGDKKLYFINKYIKSNRNIEQEWTSIRLQPVASLIFKVVEENYKLKHRQSIA